MKLIEKLKKKQTKFGFLSESSPLDMLDKINELVDAVNHIQAEYDIRCHEIEKRLGVNTKIFRPETEQIRIKTDPTITAEELAEDRAKWQMQVENYNREKGMAHLTTAFENLKRIAFGENPEGKEEFRINPETKSWNTVRYLAEMAINEFETFIKQGGQNNDK